MNEHQDEMEDLKVAHADEVFQLKEQTPSVREHDQAMEEAYANLPRELTEAQKARNDAIRERDGVVTASASLGMGMANLSKLAEHWRRTGTTTGSLPRCRISRPCARSLAYGVLHIYIRFVLCRYTM